MVALAGTPPPIVDKLAAEIKVIVSQPDVRERFYSQGIEPAFAAPDAFAGYIKATVVKYAKIVKDLGVQQE